MSPVVIALLAAVCILLPIAAIGIVNTFFSARKDVISFRSKILVAYQNASNRKLPILTDLLKSLLVDDFVEAEADVLKTIEIVMAPEKLDAEILSIVETQLPLVMQNPVNLQKITTIYNAALAAINSAHTAAQPAKATASAPAAPAAPAPVASGTPVSATTASHLVTNTTTVTPVAPAAAAAPAA